MIKIGLVPIGQIPEPLLALLSAQIKDKLKGIDLVVEVFPAVGLPEKSTPAFMLARLALLSNSDQQKFLVGLVNADITENEDDFIYDREDQHRRMCLVALSRLRPEFYTLPADEAVFQARILKLILRETALLLGLGLCQDKKCLMSYARNLHEIDIKYPSYCLDCWPKLCVQVSKR